MGDRVTDDDDDGPRPRRSRTVRAGVAVAVVAIVAVGAVVLLQDDDTTTLDTGRQPKAHEMELRIERSASLPDDQVRVLRQVLDDLGVERLRVRIEGDRIELTWSGDVVPTAAFAALLEAGPTEFDPPVVFRLVGYRSEDA